MNNKEALEALSRVVKFMNECEIACVSIDEDIKTIRRALEPRAEELEHDAKREVISIEDVSPDDFQAIMDSKIPNLEVAKCNIKIPDGMVLAPRVPTDVMIGVAYSKKYTAWQYGHSNCDLYKAMIEAIE